MILNVTMKRLPAASATLVLLLGIVGTPVLAQQDRPGMMMRPDTSARPMGMGPGRMMGPGMMQRMQGLHRHMMQRPLHRTSMAAFLLPALADTLGLSSQQTEQIGRMKQAMMARHRERRRQMVARRSEFQSLFEDEARPDAETVREHLRTVAGLRAEQRALVYETGQSMREVLTPEQRGVFDAFTPRQQMRALMARLTVADMMQMRRMMHGPRRGPGMGPRGMRPRGMGPSGKRPRMRRRQGPGNP